MNCIVCKQHIAPALWQQDDSPIDVHPLCAVKFVKSFFASPTLVKAAIEAGKKELGIA